MKGKVAWVITCEHASNALPKKFTSLVPKTELQSHKGFDLGAKEYASLLAQELSGTFFCATYSRLLIDLNRSEGNPALFSQFTKTLSPSEKSRLLTTYYRPFRKRVEEFIRKKFSQGAFVIHLACHSFTPELHGNVRDMDVGILYDPKKVRERECGRVLRRELRKNSSMSIRCNAPYRGTSDGHTSALRLLFSQEKYIGIEIEVNQRLFSKNYKDLWNKGLCKNKLCISDERDHRDVGVRDDFIARYGRGTNSDRSMVAAGSKCTAYSYTVPTLWFPLLVQACRALESSCH